MPLFVTLLSDVAMYLPLVLPFFVLVLPSFCSSYKQGWKLKAQKSELSGRLSAADERVHAVFTSPQMSPKRQSDLEQEMAPF